jgi:S-(hydroxymethyl)glutathione dehydrogenase/alcohol dehydrogenase
MKVKAAIALEKAKPLIIDYIELEGPKKVKF